jgi:hypothetical protein
MAKQSIIAALLAALRPWLPPAALAALIDDLQTIADCEHL